MIRHLGILIASLLLIGSDARATEVSLHIVQAGDTFFRLACLRFPKPNVTRKLLALNPTIQNPHLIEVGQKIVVPLSINPNANEECTTPEETVLSRDVTVESQTQRTVETPTKPLGPQISPAADPLIDPTPVQASIPATAAERRATESRHKFGRFGGYRFTTLSAEDKSSDASADLYSEYDVTIGGDWRTAWTEDFSSVVSFSLRSVEFAASTNPNKTIFDRSKTLLAASLGGVSRLSENLNLKYTADYSHQLYLHGVSTIFVGVDSIAQPSFGLEAEYKLSSDAFSDFAVSASYAYLPSADIDGYKISNGAAYAGFASYRHHHEGHTLEARIGYEERRQDTTLIEISDKSFSIFVLYSVPIFSGSRD